LQKRLTILRSLLIVATPWQQGHTNIIKNVYLQSALNAGLGSISLRHCVLCVEVCACGGDCARGALERNTWTVWVRLHKHMHKSCKHADTNAKEYGLRRRVSYVYIYLYICICVCMYMRVCVWVCAWMCMDVAGMQDMRASRATWEHWAVARCAAHFVCEIWEHTKCVLVCKTWEHLEQRVCLALQDMYIYTYIHTYLCT